jgi:hypothetical protein
MNIVKVAIAASGASTQREFGQKLGKGQTAIAKYVKQGRFPVSVLLQVEALTGIPRDRLAPELFAGYVAVESRKNADLARKPIVPEPAEAEA